jgi:hypothetical protein
MAKAVIALLAMLGVVLLGFDAAAQAKKCKEGQVYDPVTGKCVTRRGSY